MARVELDDTFEPATEQPSAASPAAGSLLMSVAFWLALLTSALIYAAVSLSPKLAGWISVRQQYASNAFRLKQLEDEADYLERVAAALKSDPEFARHLVMAEKSLPSDDAGFVPVAEDLLFGESADPVQEPPSIIQPLVANFVFHLASHQRHRTWLLGIAAGLTLLAFTLLNDAGAGIAMATVSGIGGAIRVVVGRYRTPTPQTPEGTDEINRDCPPE